MQIVGGAPLSILRLALCPIILAAGVPGHARCPVHITGGCCKFWANIECRKFTKFRAQIYCIYRDIQTYNDRLAADRIFDRTIRYLYLPMDSASILPGGFDVLLENVEVQTGDADSYAEGSRDIPRLFSLPSEEDPRQSVPRLRKPVSHVPRCRQKKQPVRPSIQGGRVFKDGGRCGASDVQSPGLRLHMVRAVQVGL